MPYTLVSFHAHPDDEALLTAGTLARAAAEGHRVVLVVATAGEAGLTANALRGAGPDDLADRRTAEVREAAAAIGCARLVLLGYADSGMADAPTGHPRSFALAEVDGAAALLAEVLREERADALTVYDPAGGYGHPDHRQVHRVGVRAAELAGTRLVLEATVDRSRLQRLLRVLWWASWVRARAVGRPSLPSEFDPDRFDAAYSAPQAITHRVDVRRHSGAKRAAMAAHRSQAAADDQDRTLALFLRLPRPLFAVVFGREWFVERGRRPGRPLDDIFASLRSAAPTAGGARGAESNGA
jgi:LmbE family N-acetylglucosaminyl deacetylase